MMSTCPHHGHHLCVLQEEDSPELHPLKEALQRARRRREEAAGIREALEAEAQEVAQLAVAAEGALAQVCGGGAGGGWGAATGVGGRERWSTTHSMHVSTLTADANNLLSPSEPTFLSHVKPPTHPPTPAPAGAQAGGGGPR